MWSVGIVADRLQALTIRVTSPDANLQGRLNGRDVRIQFRPDTYRDYDEPKLAHQLGRLLTLMSTGYRRGHGEIMKEAKLISVTDPKDAGNEAQRRYLEGVAQLAVVGKTSRGLVRIRSIGMRNWECRIADETVANLAESAFIAETEASIQTLLSNYRREIVFLKDRCYGLDIPAVRRERLAAERANG